MSPVILVLSLDFVESQIVADAIRLTVKVAGRNALVVLAACQRDYLLSLGATAVPVVVINKKIVWQGQPPEEVVREWLDWPKSLEDAVQRILKPIEDRLDTASLGWTLGMAIRNSFGLWGANIDLLRACGSETMHADRASELILAEVRRRLASRASPPSGTANAPIKPEYRKQDFDPDELLAQHGAGGRIGTGCTWSSLADLYYKVHRRRQAGEPPEHIAGALDISESYAARIDRRMAQWFDDKENAGPGIPFGRDPIEHLAAIAAVLDVPPRAREEQNLAIVKWHLREAKRKGFDWERIYRVATTARPEGLVPPPPLDAVRPSKHRADGGGQSRGGA